MRSFLKKVVVAILTLEARLVLFRRTPKIIAITGSVGKTSTKDAIATALSSSFKVRKSEKSYNSEIGVPLTILGLKNAWDSPPLWLINLFKGFFEVIGRGEYPEWLVLEVGADKPGDLQKIFSWLRADTVVVTRLPDVPVHVEFYKSPEELIKEETIPVHHIKNGGLLFLNQDDDRAMSLKESVGAETVTFGLSPRADVRGSDVSVSYSHPGEKRPLGIHFRVDNNGSSVPVQIHGVLGLQHVYPVLAAFAVGLKNGVNMVRLSESFKEHVTPPGRMRIIEGLRNTTIIDDTYNSSPVAAEEALKTLASTEGYSRKIAVLGDMLELGKYSKAEHERIGSLVPKSGHILITVGREAKGISSGALESGMDKSNIFEFGESKEAGKFLEKILKAGDIVLIKGSQSIRMERIVEEVMLHPELKEKLLVRQEEEWQRR